MNKLKTLILTLAATLMLSGCWVTALVKPTADAVVAASEFDDCKAELEAYLPDEILADLAPEFGRIETTIQDIVSAVKGDIDMEFSTALRLANISDEADTVEADFLKIADYTVAYTVNSDREPSQMLVDCDVTLRAGWKGIRDSGPAATVREFLTVAAPYAKSAIKIAPLLLQNEVHGVGDEVRLASV